MAGVENHINVDLKSGIPIQVKYGLANVLYWGYAQIGYGKIRVQKIVNNVSSAQLEDFIGIVSNGNTPSLKDVHHIGMPEYSGMSFISKILMFLDPIHYCTLDQQISKLRNPPGASMNVLDDLNFPPNCTQIRVTCHNESVYENWRTKCSYISATYYNGSFRCADIERGFFALIQSGNESTAISILNNAREYNNIGH
jgi:hypothetical protein